MGMLGKSQKLKLSFNFLCLSSHHVIFVMSSKGNIKRAQKRQRIKRNPPEKSESKRDKEKAENKQIKLQKRRIREREREDNLNESKIRREEARIRKEREREDNLQETKIRREEAQKKLNARVDAIYAKLQEEKKEIEKTAQKQQSNCNAEADKSKDKIDEMQQGGEAAAQRRESAHEESVAKEKAEMQRKYDKAKAKRALADGARRWDSLNLLNSPEYLMAKRNPNPSEAALSAQEFCPGTYTTPCMKIAPRYSNSWTVHDFELDREVPNHLCLRCGSMLLRGETSSVCCNRSGNKLIARRLKSLPDFLHSFYFGQDATNKTLRKYSRYLNNAVAFASGVYGRDHRKKRGSKWEPAMIINGKYNSMMGDLFNQHESDENDRAGNFLQQWSFEFIHDPLAAAEAANVRNFRSAGRRLKAAHFPSGVTGVAFNECCVFVTKFIKWMKTNNTFAKDFLHVFEQLDGINDIGELFLEIDPDKAPSNAPGNGVRHLRTYNDQMNEGTKEVSVFRAKNTTTKDLKGSALFIRCRRPKSTNRTAPTGQPMPVVDFAAPSQGETKESTTNVPPRLSVSDQRKEPIHRITEINPAMVPLRFPLLHPFGCLGKRFTGDERKISLAAWHKYFSAIRIQWHLLSKPQQAIFGQEENVKTTLCRFKQMRQSFTRSEEDIADINKWLEHFVPRDISGNDPAFKEQVDATVYDNAKAKIGIIIAKLEACTDDDILIKADNYNDSQSYMQRSGRLWQEYTVARYSFQLNNELMYHARNQKTMKVHTWEAYRKFQERKQQNQAADPSVSPGHFIKIMPSFIGGPSDLANRNHDAMAMVRRLGPRPDIFLTFTCNPLWEELVEEKNRRGVANVNDIPLVLGRVFSQRFQALMNDIVKLGIFGQVVGYTYAVEFQKRGLPHAHILIILGRNLMMANSKFKTAEDVEKCISAELPPHPSNFEPVTEENKEQHEQAIRLWDIVTSNNLHSKCGSHGNAKASCLRPDKFGGMSCGAGGGFPKEFRAETIWEQNARRVKYRRRSPDKFTNNKDGHCTKKGYEYDNRWVVPYSPYLSLKYDCHINLEAIVSPFKVRYLFKYIHKGQDVASLRIRASAAQKAFHQANKDNDIVNYWDTRFIGSCEAGYRISGGTMYKQEPPVFRLSVHLENQQRIYSVSDEQQEEMSKNGPSKTHLTAFFLYNLQNKEVVCTDIINAKDFPIYAEITETHCWHASKRVWTPRKRTSPSISRVRHVSPVGPTSECFFLRTLLHHEHCRKKISFEDMRTRIINNTPIVFETFKATCVSIGLLEDDLEYYKYMEEIVKEMGSSYQRRELVVVLCHCQIAEPRDLYEHVVKLGDCEMFRDLLPRSCNGCDWEDATLEDQNIATWRGLLDIETQALELNRELVHLGLGDLLDDTKRQVALHYEVTEADGNAYRAKRGFEKLVAEQTHDPDNVHALNLIEFDTLATDEQRDISDYVLNMKNDKLFIDAVGGTGKTFVLNGMLLKLRLQHKKVVLACSFTGLASILLWLGKTFHSTFKCPIDLTAGAVRQQHTATSDIGRLIIAAEYIFVDEAPMVSTPQLQWLDQQLRWTRDSQLPMGGINLVFAGDFRQTLPILKRGSNAQIISHSLQGSLFFKAFRVMRLTKNLRVMSGDMNSDEKARRVEWCKKILLIGDGKSDPVMNTQEYVQLDAQLCVASTDALIEQVYPDVTRLNSVELGERGILAPHNAHCKMINEKILDLFPGQNSVYDSADRVVDVKDYAACPTEVLNEMKPAGFPEHNLCLKKGSVVMLMRNLDIGRGHVNGTR